MYKDIIFEDEAKQKMFKGIETVAKAVGKTIGPKGKLVILENTMGSPTITKDGVSVAKDIILKDKFENLGASLIKEVAGKTNEDCGDSTSTSTLLAYSLAKEGMKLLGTGVSSVDLKNGMELAKKDIVEEIKKVSIPIQKEEDLENIATISANGDKEMGSLIAEAFNKVGINGVITVGESSTMETNIAYIEGLQFDRGMISPYFINDRERMETNFNNAYVLVVDKTIASVHELVNLLNEVAKSGKPLLIICEDMVGDALTTLISNNIQGTIRTCVVKSPYYADTRKAFLEDICILTGATFVSDTLGYKLSEMTLDNLGMADSIIVDRYNTTIVGGGGDSQAIEDRIDFINKQIETEKEGFMVEKYKERLAKLSGGVALINIGANTEVEMKEKKHRVEDTLSATRSALESGIIVGGGVTLANISKKLKDKDISPNEKIGYNLVLEAIKEPLRQISENADMNGDLVVRDTLDKSDGKSGYDISTGEWVSDMVERGIVDPSKAISHALINAISVVSLLLMTECCITINMEENKVTQ